MKTIVRGIIYAFTLNVINFLIGEMAPHDAYAPLGVVLFALAGLFFLKSETIDEFLSCGFTALGFLFIIQFFFIGLQLYTWSFIEIYVYGLLGTVIAIVASVLIMLTRKYRAETGRKRTMEEHNIFDKTQKIKLLLYALITAVGFSYFVMPQSSGVGVFVFAILQALLLFFVVPDKKRLLWCIPIAVLCLNFFISANKIWHISNFIVCTVLFSLMFVKLDIKNTAVTFLGELASRVFTPIEKIAVPFEWAVDMAEGKKGYVKKALIALVLSLLAVGALSAVLSSADMVFSHGVGDVIKNIENIFSINVIMKIIAGIFAGVYLFGVVLSSYEEYEFEEKALKIKGDTFIISAVMLSVLAVYTIFVVIQFKYLFSGSELPYGLNVTEYARKGFFELLALTGVNIVIILLVTKLTGHLTGKKSAFVKALNMYLCSVTVVLLASSFYRMWLYNETDGLTRLRFLVFGFLAFEFIGLIFTFFYIAKPKFNIVMVYGAIALLYYMVLNVVPMDKIVAKNQVDRYLSGERDDVSYVMTLSPDAASEIKRIYEKSNDYQSRHQARIWILENYKEYENTTERWQRLNLSVVRLNDICIDIKTAP